MALKHTTIKGLRAHFSKMRALFEAHFRVNLMNNPLVSNRSVSVASDQRVSVQQKDEYRLRVEFRGQFVSNAFPSSSTVTRDIVASLQAAEMVTLTDGDTTYRLEENKAAAKTGAVLEGLNLS